MRSLRTVALAFGAILLAGCAIPIRLASVSPEVPADAPPRAIRSSLDALDDPANKKKLEAILTSAEVKRIQREMADSLLDSSLASLDEPARTKRVSEIGEKYVRGLMSALSKEMSGDVGPLARNLAKSAVRGALDEAMGSRADDGTGPKQDANLRAVLREQMAPALADVLRDPDFQKAMGELARTMGREAVVGANQGLHEVQEGAPREASLLGRVAALAKGGAKVMSTLSWVLVAAVVLLGVWITKLLLQVRRAAKRGAARPELAAPTPAATVAMVANATPRMRPRTERPRARPRARHLVARRARG